MSRVLAIDDERLSAQAAARVEWSSAALPYARAGDVTFGMTDVRWSGIWSSD
jgi:hypothetical protein